VAPVLLTWDRYASRWSGLHGGLDPRTGGPVLRWWLHLAYRTGWLLARLGVPPAAVTGLGLVLCVLVPLTARQGRAAPLIGAALVLLSALADAVDGAIAVVTDRVTRLGYVYDSVADRLGEAAWLTGLWLLGTPVWLAVPTGAVTWLHEYLRTRATAAGMKAIGARTMTEHRTRAVIAATGLALAGVAGLATRALAAGTVTFAAAAWLLFGLFSLGQLLVAVHAAFRHRAGERHTG
jgi:phosphatidylglycerophosphate synthase